MSKAKRRRHSIVPALPTLGDTSPIPRDQLRELLDRVRRGEVSLEEAFGAADASGDRPTPVVVHHAGLEAWLAAKR